MPDIVPPAPERSLLISSEYTLLEQFHAVIGRPLSTASELHMLSIGEAASCLARNWMLCYPANTSNAISRLFKYWGKPCDSISLFKADGLVAGCLPKIRHDL